MHTPLVGVDTSKKRHMHEHQKTPRAYKTKFPYLGVSKPSKLILSNPVHNVLGNEDRVALKKRSLLQPDVLEWPSCQDQNSFLEASYMNREPVGIKLAFEKGLEVMQNMTGLKGEVDYTPFEVSLLTKKTLDVMKTMMCNQNISLQKLSIECIEIAASCVMMACSREGGAIDNHVQDIWLNNTENIRIPCVIAAAVLRLTEKYVLTTPSNVRVLCKVVLDMTKVSSKFQER